MISSILTEAERRTDVRLGIVSDDWVFLTPKENETVARRLSQEYRIDRDTTTDQRFGISPTFNKLMNIYKPDHSAKASIPVAALCAAMGHEDLTEMKVNKIVVLDPAQEQYIRNIDLEEALTVLSASTANVPPLNAQELDNRREFWSARFQECGGISINNRHPNMPLKAVVSAILEFAIK